MTEQPAAPAADVPALLASARALHCRLPDRDECIQFRCGFWPCLPSLLAAALEQVTAERDQYARLYASEQKRTNRRQEDLDKVTAERDAVNAALERERAEGDQRAMRIYELRRERNALADALDRVRALAERYREGNTVGLIRSLVADEILAAAAPAQPQPEPADVVELTREEGRALFHRKAQEVAGMHGEEFLAAYDRGDIGPDDGPGIAELILLIPFARTVEARPGSSALPGDDRLRYCSAGHLGCPGDGDQAEPCDNCGQTECVGWCPVVQPGDGEGGGQ